MFVTGSTSVNGDRLAERLIASGAQVTVAGYEPDRFVHAKLVGVTAGRRAWLLSGSANISRARAHADRCYSRQCRTRRPRSARSQRAAAAFVPPAMTLGRTAASAAWPPLASAPTPSRRLPAVRLLTATALADGRIEIVSDPVLGDGWLLDDLTSTSP